MNSAAAAHHRRLRPSPGEDLRRRNNGVEWVATDDNLDPRGVTLQCKWPASREWTTVTDRAFRTSDRFAWKLDPGKVLEVRVLAKDQAGHETVLAARSRPAGRRDRRRFPRPTPGGGRRNGSAAAAASNLPAARIDYVNTLEFDVDYTIEQMGPSGVKAAHLFVRKNQGDWTLVKRYSTI